jgi:hypothetical protein
VFWRYCSRASEADILVSRGDAAAKGVSRDMESIHGRPADSLKGDAWTWIMLAVLLVLGAIVGVGGIALVNFNQMHEVATGSQDTPSSALKK